MLNVQPGPRDRRLLSTLLILGVIAVSFYIVGQLTERIVERYAEARVRYAELIADPGRVDEILAAGAERVRPLAESTMAEVREKMGLR